MRKTAVAKKDEPAENTAVVPVGDAPGFLQERMRADSGKGISTRAEDNLIPIIYILQAQSPQVLKKNPAYIEGSEAGMWWLRNSPVPLVSGDVGFAFQPCYFNIDWVEWLPRDEGGGGGQGFIGRYPERPEDAVRHEDERNPNIVHWTMPSGNDLVETRNHVGFVVGGLFGLLDQPRLVMPYAISLSSSGHTSSRQWMSLMNQFSGPNGEDPVSFSRLYRLTTRYRTNAQGEWYVLQADDAGWVRSAEEYDRGLNLFNSMLRAEKGLEAPVTEVGGGEAAGVAAERAGV